MKTIPYIQTAGGFDTGETFISNPVKCDFCEQKDLIIFITGYTKTGSWLNMCPECHQKHGIGLGILKGQKYEFKSVQANELN